MDVPIFSTSNSINSINPINSIAKDEKMSLSSNISDEIVIKIKDLKKELTERFSVSSIGVFGSATKERLKKESDIDILVELKEPTFDHYMDLKFRLEEVFGRDVDLVLKDTLKPRLKPVIEKEVRYV